MLIMVMKGRSSQSLRGWPARRAQKMLRDAWRAMRDTASREDGDGMLVLVIGDSVVTVGSVCGWEGVGESAVGSESTLRPCTDDARASRTSPRLISRCS